MYYILFKRLSYNRFRCLGIYKDYINVDNYPLFKDQKEDSTYSYIKLTDKEIKNIKLIPGDVYKYQNGLEHIKEFKEDEVGYKPLIEDNEDLDLSISKLKYNYGISSQFITPLAVTLYKMNLDNRKKDLINRSKTIWYQADIGMGKSYFLKAVSETAVRPTLIIDCEGIKPTSKRDLFNKLLERILDGFKDDREKTNNAIIMFDNFDKIDVPDEEIDEYIASVPVNFAISEKKIESKKYGFDNLQMNNNIFIFTSTRELIKDPLNEIDMYPFYENISYNEISKKRVDIENYVIRYLDGIRYYYLIKGITIDFKEEFIYELGRKTFFMNRGYYGTQEMVKQVLENLDTNNYSKFTICSFDNIISQNVLRNVR